MMLLLRSRSACLSGGPPLPGGSAQIQWQVWSHSHPATIPALDALDLNASPGMWVSP
jgi:hypothetical protein